MSNIFKGITDAEAVIADRKKVRDGNQIEFRSVIALEALSDDLTRVHAELQVMRYLAAQFMARP
ncbi:hypothetical protein AB8A05_10950 [Tardiphaga sp. 538_B7_N1_4]|uniref:hypothetical protein n=1 Tax=Tardiphaga sp. 538_B7_N1_4 TaxID=3240778 RepID=UPI003F282458